MIFRSSQFLLFDIFCLYTIDKSEQSKQRLIINEQNRGKKNNLNPLWTFVYFSIKMIILVGYRIQRTGNK